MTLLRACTDQTLQLILATFEPLAQLAHKFLSATFEPVKRRNFVRGVGDATPHLVGKHLVCTKHRTALERAPLGGENHVSLERALPLGGENHVSLERAPPLGGENHVSLERAPPLGGENHVSLEKAPPLGEENHVSLEKAPLSSKASLQERTPPRP